MKLRCCLVTGFYSQMRLTLHCFSQTLVIIANCSTNAHVFTNPRISKTHVAMKSPALITRTVTKALCGAAFTFALLAVAGKSACAQMPPNLDFSHGNFTNWFCYTGTADTGTAATGTAFVNAVLSGPIAGPPSRHALTSGPGLDTVGQLQAVAPGGGTHSIRIGNHSVGPNAKAERVRYYLHVPAGTTRYSLLYQFAVVLNNGSHASKAQASFHVVAYDSASGAVIPSANNLYLNANLPSVVPYLPFAGSGGYFHSWAPSTLNLSGYGGKTIILEVMSSDCAHSGHFAYGYFDVISEVMHLAPTVSNCDLQANTLTVQGPPGYKHYQWYNQNFSVALNPSLDTARSWTLPLPSSPQYYNLVLIPVSSIGRPDTIRTNILSSFTINATAAPASVAAGDTVHLSTAVTGGLGSLTYQWTGDTTLSSSSLPNPTANPMTGTKYVVTVTDTNGCFRRDTVQVNVGALSAKPDVVLSNTSIVSMPNAFSPGASLNGRYRIVRIQPGYTLHSFRIYNRWGVKVFETTNAADGWDGSFNGAAQPMAAYVYVLEAVSASGKSVTQQGSVTLLR